MTYIATLCYTILVNQIWRTAQQDGGQEAKKMYTAKLFSTAAMPVSIVAINAKSVAEAKRYAISVASDFDIPGYDAIHTILLYVGGTKIDTITL